VDKDPTLSEEVQSYIAGRDWETDHDIPLEERSEARKNRRLVQAIVEAVVRSREMIADKKLEAVEVLVAASPDLIAYFLDYFTREVINAVPGYVERMLQLSAMKAERLPSTVTNGYLKEAVRTYVLGLPQASVALCRAALEQALKEGIGYKSSCTPVEMNDLLDEAETAGVIDKTIRKMAREVATSANHVLHEKPTTLATAYEVLVKLRGILHHVYAEP